MSQTEFTIREAAERTGVGTKTISRRRKAGQFPNAHRRGDGSNAPWIIPTNDLIAAGLTLTTDVVPEGGSTATIPLDELDQLRSETADYRRRAEVAETALQRADQTIEAQRMALRALESGPLSPNAARGPQTAVAASVAAPAPATPIEPTTSILSDVRAVFRRRRR